MTTITLGSDPIDINFNIIPGSTFRESITVGTGTTEAEAKANPTDFTGATAELFIVNPDNTTEIYHTMNTSNGGITMDANGKITLFVSKEDSSAFVGVWELGVYESLEITYPGGDVEPFSRGDVCIGNEFTKP